MQLHAEVVWKKGTFHAYDSIQASLKEFVEDKEEALEKLLPQVEESFLENVKFVIKCGFSDRKSFFFFNKGTPDSSEIVGIPAKTRSFKDLESDWDFLKRKIGEAKVSHKLECAEFRLNDSPRLREINLPRFLLKKENLAFLASLSGVVPLASALLGRTLSYDTLITPPIGIFLWFMICYYSFMRKGDYDIET